MIGSRVGTGGSSGEQYLQGAVARNYVFRDLASIITFLIERCRLPALPSRLRQALRFTFTR
jgi:tryptophan 2,3-dioxygenase